MSEVITICWNSYVKVNMNRSIPPHMLHSARLEITWNKYPGSSGLHLSLARKWYRGRTWLQSILALVWNAPNTITQKVIVRASMALEWHTAELLMTPWSRSLYDIAHCNQQNVRPLMKAVMAPMSWIDQSLKKRGNNMSSCNCLWGISIPLCEMSMWPSQWIAI